MNPNYRIELAENNKGRDKMTFNNASYLDTIIKVIGVGNGGCNAVNRMIEEGLENVDFVAMNTDAQALSRSNAPTRVVLGERITEGLGAGTDPEKGADAAREDMAKIEEIVSGANLVFIASSFGGGTGTGASPVVAEAAKKAGALTIGVITKPFEYEGKLKMNRAESGIDKMLTVVDSLIIIPNENLYDMVDMDNYEYEEALSVVDDILRQGVQGISDIITQTGFINVDFADVKTMISLSNGRAHLGIGVGKGDDRLNKSITNAFENPLLDVSSIKNARGILANIVCPKDFAMKEYREASKIINNYANENANIKIGVCPKDDIKDEIIVTIVATGFDANSKIDSNNKNDDSNFKSNNDNIASNNSNNVDIKSSDNEITNKVTETIVENNSNKNNDKIISENSVENISEIDNINTIIREPVYEQKEIELKAFSMKESDKNIEENNSFENKIKNLRKPLITKNNKNRFNNLEINEKLENDIKDMHYNNDVSYNNSDEIDNNEEFNKSVVNSHIVVEKLDDTSHSKKNDDDKYNDNKIPFDVAMDDYTEAHNKMGYKMAIFGETSSIDDDLEKPAFLRRQIQARNTIR